MQSLSIFPINCIHNGNVNENTEKQKLLRFPHCPRGVSHKRTCQVLLDHRDGLGNHKNWGYLRLHVKMIIFVLFEVIFRNRAEIRIKMLASERTTDHSRLFLSHILHF